MLTDSMKKISLKTKTFGRLLSHFLLYTLTFLTLVESNKILPENEKVVRTLNDFFSNIVKDLLKFFAYISQNVRFMTCLTKILENILFNN